MAQPRRSTGNAVISAVGQLNRPSIPPIAGLPLFRGPVFHTARWDHTVDLQGKRVAMIGTGASAVQAGPRSRPTSRACWCFSARRIG